LLVVIAARSGSRLERFATAARSSWSAVYAFVGTPGAALTVFVLALGVYSIEATAWPLDRGRDAWDYWTYYLQMWRGDPVFRPLMSMRTPITPLLVGVPMQIGGAALLEIVYGVLYAASVLAWSMIALTFGRLAALVSALVLLAYPPFGSLFHYVASDGVFAASFSLWCLAMVRTARAPATWKFALLGVGAGVVFLARPPGGVLLAFVLFPLVLSVPFRRRLVWAGTFIAVAGAFLVGWMAYNDLRYDDFTLTRQRTGWVPFGAVFSEGKIKAGNGPASRELYSAVEKHVLTEPPYRSVRETPATYFSNPSNYEFIHLLALSDRVWGWGSDYRVLRQAATEAGSSGSLASGVGDTVRDVRQMLSFVFWRERSTIRQPQPPPPAIQVVDGKRVPNPGALGPAPEMVPYGWIWCPSPMLSRCVADDPVRAIPDPGLRRQYVSVVERLGKWDANLPPRNGNAWLADQLKRYTWHLPRGWFWLALAIIGLAIRRPAGTRICAAIVALGFLVILAHAVSSVVDPAYALAVYPAFIVPAMIGLFGDRPASGPKAT
jgi:hypothetical protein